MGLLLAYAIAYWQGLIERSPYSTGTPAALSRAWGVCISLLGSTGKSRFEHTVTLSGRCESSHSADSLINSCIYHCEAGLELLHFYVQDLGLLRRRAQTRKEVENALIRMNASRVRRDLTSAISVVSAKSRKAFAVLASVISGSTLTQFELEVFSPRDFFFMILHWIRSGTHLVSGWGSGYAPMAGHPEIRGFGAVHYLKGSPASIGIVELHGKEKRSGRASSQL